MSAHILIVEDEEAIRAMIALALEQAGFEVDEADDANLAWNKVNDRLPDLVLLDWMLPGVSGVEFARRMRREEMTREIPIIMLTARTEEHDKIRGLDAGADDYITKPFSPKEMMARIRAVLRRAKSAPNGEALQADGLMLDPVSHRVTSNEDPVDLGPTEYRLLHFFMRHPDRVFSRSQLLDRVWGSGVYVEERTVDVHIRRLRKALTPGGHEKLIQTVRGAGYRFSDRE